MLAGLKHACTCMYSYLFHQTYIPVEILQDICVNCRELAESESEVTSYLSMTGFVAVSS